MVLLVLLLAFPLFTFSSILNFNVPIWFAGADKIGMFAIVVVVVATVELSIVLALGMMLVFDAVICGSIVIFDGDELLDEFPDDELLEDDDNGTVNEVGVDNDAGCNVLASLASYTTLVIFIFLLVGCSCVIND